MSDVFRCSKDFFQMFSAVFRCSFRCFNWSQIFFRDSQMCLRCAQMFSDVHRCVQMITDVFWIFSWYSIDVILMFSRCSLDVQRILHDFSRMFSGCSDGSCGPGGISNESMDFNDPKELDDTIYSMIPALRWSPAIRWSPAFQWSPAIEWSIWSMVFDNPKVCGDTSITDGLVFDVCCAHCQKILHVIDTHSSHIIFIKTRPSVMEVSP